MAAVARDAHVSRTTVSMWFRGVITSANVERIAAQHALKLIEAESLKNSTEPEQRLCA
jgi:hypothetical protein